MSPQLKSVEAAGRHALSRKNQPNRLQVDDFFAPLQRVKAAFAHLIACDQPGRIAFIPSVSYGVATVARNLPLQAGPKILVLKDQFPSNYYTWQRLAQERGGTVETIAVSEGPHKGQRWTKAILAAINEQTACVAMCHVHWAEGVRYDLAAIRQRTREVGAWLVVDGTQSVGALPFSVVDFDPDALICAAYKWLMGPYATALAYYGPVMDDGIPIEENWINRRGSHDFRNLLNYQSDYQPLAGRYCMGEQSNFVLLPMLETALQQINAWQAARVQEYCRQLNTPFIDQLQALGYQLQPPNERAEHLLGVQLPPQLPMERVQAALKAAQIVVSYRGNSIRIAPHVYNHPADWEKLLSVLRRL
ncbi:MAG: aminotransferase class V-fold PLP-dependent enzyme [Bacteroidetes bacterium]|nr:MAG: aminotransferase class V-fold PLP-dependent enzyme [Bacteroidota bacterium]